MGRGSRSNRGFAHELSQMFGASNAGHLERRKALGDVAEGMLEAGLKASVLVIQAGGKGLNG